MNATRDASLIRLTVGDRQWSTWTLRVWLILKRLALPFEEVAIPLRTDETQELIDRHSPSGWIPTLEIDGMLLWESIAIAEYLAERYSGLWPSDPRTRALARCACAEMHAGFPALRAECPMELGLVTTRRLSTAAARDVRRLVALWSDLRNRFGREGPFLFGQWSIADAFYTPVATRLRSYSIDFSGLEGGATAAAYAGKLLAAPEFLSWERLALSAAPSRNNRDPCRR